MTKNWTTTLVSNTVSILPPLDNIDHLSCAMQMAVYKFPEAKPSFCITHLIAAVESHYTLLTSHTFLPLISKTIKEASPVYPTLVTKRLLVVERI
jgi:hypothetical protein